MFSFKIRHIPLDPSTLRLPEPPSPMPDQVHSIQQSMAEASIVQTRSASSSALRPPSAQATPGMVLAGQDTAGSKAEEYRKWNERGREWLYGYVWFEQRKDGGIARGYMQVSPDLHIIVITDSTADLPSRNRS